MICYPLQMLTWLDLNKVNLCSVPEITVEDSRFIGYGAEIMNVEQVIDYYKHLKIKHADATHISMAFRLPGENVAELQDYFDDADYGMGRSILNVLVDEQEILQGHICGQIFWSKTIEREEV